MPLWRSFLWYGRLRCCDLNLGWRRWRCSYSWHSQACFTGGALNGLTRKFIRYLQALIATGTRYFHFPSAFNSSPVLPPCLRRRLLDQLDPIVLHGINELPPNHNTNCQQVIYFHCFLHCSLNSKFTNTPSPGFVDTPALA